MSIRVRTASRLHFGLLSLECGARFQRAEQAGTLATCPTASRQFGGVGLMVQEPGCEVLVERAASWSAHGPLAERALAFAKTAAVALPHTQAEAPPFGPYKIEVTRAAPEHMGLGTGTQLALAVVRAMTMIHKLKVDAATLAALVGRGTRSAIGIHGFAEGGFLIDGGKGATTAIAPLVARWIFPPAWRAVLIVPRGRQGLHGLAESEVFATQQDGDLRTTEALCRIVLLGVLPALREADLDRFGEALFDFNRRVGELFRPWQGDVYGHPQSAAIVDFVRRQGVRGVGQSSWGPALFAITDSDHATALAHQLREHFNFSPDEVLVSKAANHGARVEFAGSM